MLLFQLCGQSVGWVYAFHLKSTILTLPSVLDIVHVVPLYQRSGVGAALLDWGLEQADKEGVQCYVESSPSARSLCEKKGFRYVGEIKIELGRYKEGYREYKHTVMLRPFRRRKEMDQPLSELNPFDDDPEMSPVSPFVDDSEVPYTAEAKMLEFRSTSSLRSARLTDTRGSKRSLSQESNHYRDIPAPVPKTPALTKLLG